MAPVSEEQKHDVADISHHQSSTAAQDHKTLCEICHKGPRKYKCPKCLLQTCSLPCVKEHKKIKDCDGVRCKTAFVPMSAFNENHLLSDYRFLEEIGRSCDNNERELQQSSSSMTKWMYIQKKEARKMNINLKLAPKTFSLHKENSTVFITKKKSFCWHMVLQFPKEQISLTRRRIPDTMTVLEALKEAFQENLIEIRKLSSYLDETVLVFMRRLDFPSNQEKYHAIDIQNPIKEVLRGKTVVEFPQFIFILPCDAEQYESKVSEEISPYLETPAESFQNQQQRQTSYGRGNRKRRFRDFGGRSRSPEKRRNVRNCHTHLVHSLNHNIADTFP